jgi:hypothetical protein
MDKGYITIVKVEYTFQDGNKMQGIELNLAPKVKKFIRIDKDNADLLKLMGNGLIDWYYRAELGDDLVLSAYTGKDKLVSNDGQVPVNFV